jgi:hypothetical protein
MVGCLTPLYRRETSKGLFREEICKECHRDLYKEIYVDEKCREHQRSL